MALEQIFRLDTSDGAMRLYAGADDLLFDSNAAGIVVAQYIHGKTNFNANDANTFHSLPLSRVYDRPPYLFGAFMQVVASAPDVGPSVPFTLAFPSSASGGIMSTTTDKWIYQERSTFTAGSSYKVMHSIILNHMAAPI